MHIEFLPLISYHFCHLFDLHVNYDQTPNTPFLFCEASFVRLLKIKIKDFCFTFTYSSFFLKYLFIFSVSECFSLYVWHAYLEPKKTRGEYVSSVVGSPGTEVIGSCDLPCMLFIGIESSARQQASLNLQSSIWQCSGYIFSHYFTYFLPSFLPTSLPFCFSSLFLFSCSYPYTILIA